MNSSCLWTGIAALLAGLLLWGCEDTERVYITEPDLTAPGVPRGVNSLTGDRQVTVYWYGSTEPDLALYIIYRDDEDPDDLYEEIGRVHVNEFRSQWSFIDRDVQNSHTYFYAVSAVDYEGNESDLSYEDVFDTPRPEGFNVYVDATADQSGWSFIRRMKVSRNSPDADIIFDYDEQLETIFIEAADANDDIQDFGYADAIDEVGWAPEEGWSSVGWCEVILGHTYVVWTDANRYAKVRVFDMGSTWVRFDWAHQEDPGNPELKPVVPDSLQIARP